MFAIFFAILSVLYGSVLFDIIMGILIGVYHATKAFCSVLSTVWTLICVTARALPAASVSFAGSVCCILDCGFQWLWNLPRIVYETACLFHALTILLHRLRDSIRRCECMFVELREFYSERKLASTTLMAKVDDITDPNSKIDFWLCLPIVFSNFLGDSFERARVLGVITFFSECSFKNLKDEVYKLFVNFSRAINFQTDDVPIVNNRSVILYVEK